MISLVTSGEGVHTFGSSEFHVGKNMLCFTGPNSINSWKSVTDDQQGYVVCFSDEFFHDGLINRHVLCELPFFQVDGTPILPLTDQQTQEYLTLFGMIRHEYQTGGGFSLDVVRGLLHALVNKSRSHVSPQQSGSSLPNNSGVRLVKAFTALYMKDINTIRTGKEIQVKKISRYASELGVSAHHLNDTIKSVTGRSAGQLIRSQLTRQATMCLKHSSKTISEIAYLLGFEDPSYFSRFYKKQTGKMPSDFRTAR